MMAEQKCGFAQNGRGRILHLERKRREMSKGIGPPATKPTPKPAPRKPKKKTSEEGSSGTEGNGVAPECWSFLLTDPTPAGVSASAGLVVQGIPDQSRVMIVSSLGTLGFAPFSISKVMLSAIGITGGTLSGEVLSVASEQTTAQVQLCAYRDD